MIRGPKYKIARRLGPTVFDKTQTQKYALRAGSRKIERRGPKSDYGLQMIEKQRARFTYGVNERQFSNYVKMAVSKKGVNAVEGLFAHLENRLDNIVYRLGLSASRAGGRQMVSHGHITINGRRVTIPSYQVGIGDKIAIREGSRKLPFFATLDEKIKDREAPAWISFDKEKKEAVVEGVPRYNPVESGFDLRAVIEFYSR